MNYLGKKKERFTNTSIDKLFFSAILCLLGASIFCIFILKVEAEVVYLLVCLLSDEYLGIFLGKVSLSDDNHYFCITKIKEVLESIEWICPANDIDKQLSFDRMNMANNVP